VSEPANFPSRLEAIVRAVIEDGKGTIAERAMLKEIDALRAELERTRVSLHVEAAAADAEATFANELNVDVAALRARVRELEGALRDARDVISASVLGIILGLKPTHEAEPEINRVVDRIDALLPEPAQ
jgi:hypothetical protein